MVKWLLFPAMLYCHVIDDYVLQGILANLKQKIWWKKNAPQPLYRYDYIIALLAHAFSWSFSIALPALIAAVITSNERLMGTILLSYVLNTGGHALIDHLKCNVFAINLVEDQLLHVVQILISWFFFVLGM